MKMLKYLLQHAWEVLCRDGPVTVVQEAMKYLGLYYTPDKLVKWWLTRLAHVKVVAREVQGSTMMLDLSDRGIHRDLYLHGIREPQATRYLQGILQPGWTVVDIGANIGYYALQEARVVQVVIAIEPSPDNYRALVNNVRLNDYKNVLTYRLAVGDKEGVVGLALSHACNWNSIAEVGGDIDVMVTTLDRFVDGGRVDFVRMDVEGYEMKVLRGMEDILRKYRPRMFLEVHRDKLVDYGNSQREVMEYLAGFGYSIEKAFVMGRDGISGRRIDKLLADREMAKVITEQGIASHLFFSCGAITGMAIDE